MKGSVGTAGAALFAAPMGAKNGLGAGVARACLGGAWPCFLETDFGFEEAWAGFLGAGFFFAGSLSGRGGP